MMNETTKKSDLVITKELVREANPEFFSPTMMEFIGTTEEEWDVAEFKGQPCILVQRPVAQAIACYFVNPVTYKLAYWCHIGDKLTQL